MNPNKPGDYKGIYGELIPLLGVEIVECLYYHYRGQQITFPNRLYSSQYVERYIKMNYNGENHRELAKEFNYSERWMRKLIEQYKKQG